MLVLPIELVQSIQTVVSQSLAAVDHNWVLNKVATPLGTFHIIILSRKKIVMAFFFLFEFGRIPSGLVWAPKIQLYITGEFYFMYSLHPHFSVEYTADQQSPFNCAVVGLFEAGTSPRKGDVMQTKSKSG